MSIAPLHRVELHRHIDCSLRPATLANLAKKSEKEIREKFWLTKPLGSLQEVLNRLTLFQKVLSSTEILERVAFEAVEDAFHEGITKLELRYSPRFASEHSKIPWEEVLKSFQCGIQRGISTYPIQVGLICILSRREDFGVAQEAIDFAICHRDDFIGVDLAGPEVGFPCRLYKDLFRKARDAGFPITIHAGEGCDPENIWEAIDLLGAMRIGHGCRAIEDLQLMLRLARDQILIETCPTSNIITRAVGSWQEHPLPRFLDVGIPCSISTDDPGIFGVTLQDEFERCKKWMGMSEADLKRCNELAEKHSFFHQK